MVGAAVRSLLALLTPREDRIIRRAARAESDYWKMVRTVDDAHRRQAMIERRVHCDAELRGDSAPPPPTDLAAPIEVAVARELEAMRPAVTLQVQRSREVRRLASDCGLTQLQLAVTPAARRQLRAIVRTSQLSVREIAGALGVADRTLERHIAGETMSRERRDWYGRLLRIFQEGHEVYVVTRRLAPTRKPWGWHLTREEKGRLFSGEGEAAD